MAVSIQVLNIGATPGDRAGNTPYVGIGKPNTNFSNLKVAADLVLDVLQNYILGRLLNTSGSAGTAQIKLQYKKDSEPGTAWRDV